GRHAQAQGRPARAWPLRRAPTLEPAMTHTDFEQLAAGYGLGALEPDDENTFRRHLEGCTTCEAAVRELEGVVGALAYTATPVEPPPSLRAPIRREIPATARPRPPPCPRPRRHRTRPGAAHPAWLDQRPGRQDRGGGQHHRRDRAWLLEPQSARPERPVPAARRRLRAGLAADHRD